MNKEGLGTIYPIVPMATMSQQAVVGIDRSPDSSLGQMADIQIVGFVPYFVPWRRQALQPWQPNSDHWHCRGCPFIISPPFSSLTISSDSAGWRAGRQAGRLLLMVHMQAEADKGLSVVELEDLRRKPLPRPSQPSTYVVHPCLLAAGPCTPYSAENSEATNPAKIFLEQ